MSFIATDATSKILYNNLLILISNSNAYKNNMKIIFFVIKHIFCFIAEENSHLVAIEEQELQVG